MHSPVTSLKLEIDTSQPEDEPSLLKQAKTILGKSKLGFLGKMTELDLERAI